MAETPESDEGKEELIRRDGDDLFDSDDDDSVQSDGDGSVLTDEYNDPMTPPHLRKLAAIIRVGNADALRQALDNLDDHIDKPVSERYTALHLATKEGHLSCVELLLKRGANLEANVNGSISLPLHTACFKGYTDIAQLLLQSANSPACMKRMVEACNTFGNTPLHFAAHNGLVDTIKLLLDSGASPTKTNITGRTPIDKAKPNSEARRILEEAARTKPKEKKTTQNQAVPLNRLVESNEDKISVCEDGRAEYYSDSEMPPHLQKLATVTVVQHCNKDALQSSILPFKAGKMTAVDMAKPGSEARRVLEAAARAKT